MNKEWNDLKESLNHENDPFTYKDLVAFKWLIDKIQLDIDVALSSYIGQDK